MKKALFTVFTVLFLDQALKIWVKMNMYLTEKIPVAGDWFHLHFLENRGMAFGMEFGGDWGKLALSIFRIVAVIVIAYYLRHLIKQKVHNGLIICGSLVLAGALGNIIDSAVYGLIFSDSPAIPGMTASFMPQEGGYAKFLMGDVVDMLYFPLANWYWPNWIPWIGGEHFEFFRPVFNISDTAITTGLITIFVFQKRFFAEPEGQLEEVFVGDEEE